MGFRTAAKVDANQKKVTKDLRRMGVFVLLTHQLKNCCDMFCAYRGVWLPFELKDPEKTASQTELTAGEKEFFEKAGYHGPVYKVFTAEEIMQRLNAHAELMQKIPREHRTAQLPHQFKLLTK